MGRRVCGKASCPSRNCVASPPYVFFYPLRLGSAAYILLYATSLFTPRFTASPAQANAIASASLTNLKVLTLVGFQIGDAGLKALSSAIATKQLANLELLRLRIRHIGDAGITELCNAMTSGSLQILRS